MTFAPPGAFSANCLRAKLRATSRLTRQMVGLKPPLPRSYSFFRFSTAFATILFALTFAANALTQLPRMYTTGAPAPAIQEAYGMGGVGGGPAELCCCDRGSSCNGGSPSRGRNRNSRRDFGPGRSRFGDVTCTHPERGCRCDGSASRQSGGNAVRIAGSAPGSESGGRINSGEQPRSQSQALIPVVWQIALFILILISGLIAFLLRRSAIQKWK